MLKNLIKKLFPPKINYYSDWGSDEIKGVKPNLIKTLTKDIDLELYLVKPDYALAFVAVKVGEKVYRTKYDSGRVFNDLDKMAEDCVGNIRVFWDFDYWRKEARDKIAMKWSFFR